MKPLHCIVWMLFSMLAAAQPLPDSILTKYKKEVLPEKKGAVLSGYLNPMRERKTTNEIIKILYSWLADFEREDDPIATAYLKLHIGITFQSAGDFSAAVKYGIHSIREFEKIGDTTALITSYMLTGNALKDFKNVDQAQKYYLKCHTITKAYGKENFTSAILNNIADCYNQMKMPDSALPRVQEAIAIAEKQNNTLYLASFFCTLGEAYFVKKEHEIGRPFIRKSINFAHENDDAETLAYGFGVLSQSFYDTVETDSSLISAYRSLDYSEPDYKLLSSNAYELLYKNYNRKRIQDSTFKYLMLSKNLKDSLFSNEKSRSIQALHSHEQMREQEMELENQRVENKRRLNIQYALSGAIVVTLLVIFLILSHSIVVNTRMVRFFSIIGLLLVFEFLNLVLHPFLDRITNHSPMLMLFAMVCIAALLILAHHKIERWATLKLTEKNKKIRLDAAKKTIEKLERESIATPPV